MRNAGPPLPNRLLPKKENPQRAGSGGGFRRQFRQGATDDIAACGPKFNRCFARSLMERSMFHLYDRLTSVVALFNVMVPMLPALAGLLP